MRRKCRRKIEKILKIENFTPNLQNLTYVAIFLKILNQEQNIAFIHLVRSGTSRWGQNWFCFWCATKTLDFRVKYVSYLMNLPIFSICWQIYHIFHSKIQSFCRTSKTKPVLASAWSPASNKMYKGYIKSPPPTKRDYMIAIRGYDFLYLKIYLWTYCITRTGCTDFY